MLTKKAAAKRAGISTRSLERYTQQRRIPVGYRTGKTAREAIYRAEDVDRLKKELAATKEAVIMPPAAEGPSALAKRDGASLARMASPELIEALGRIGAALGAQGTAAPVSELRAKLTLTRHEAARASGLPLADLKRAIDSGELPAIKTGAGWRIKTGDLETYVRKL